MSFIKINPVFHKNSLPDFIDDIFNRSISDIVGSDFTTNVPSVNIIEEEGSFHIELAAPGLTKKDFNIEIKDDRLFISAKKEEKRDESEEGKFRRREFNYYSFSRSFMIPENVNQDDISANYEDGILKIRLNKLPEAKEEGAKVIEIK